MRSSLTPLFVLLALLSAHLASASVLFMSSFDAVDDAATTAVDSVEFNQTIAGGAADLDIQPVVNAASTPVHKANNGGSDSSFRSLRVDVASGEQAYYSLKPKPCTDDADCGGTVDTWTLCTNGTCTYASGAACPAGVCPYKRSTLAVAFNLYLQTKPAVNKVRNVAEIREDDGAGSTQQGCYLEVNGGNTPAARTATMRYRGGAAVGTTSEKLQPGSCCETAAGVDCNFRQECPTPGAGTGCTAPTANCVCDTTTGAGCYWAGVELIEAYASPTAVVCELWIDGRLTLASGTIATTGAGPPVDVRLGAVSTETTVMTAFFDDIVIDDDSARRAHYGYVAAAVPTTPDGTTIAWNRDNCGAGSAHFPCLDDWVSGAVYAGDNTDQVTTSAINKLEQMTKTTPAPTIRTDESVSMVEYLLYGAGNGTIKDHCAPSCLNAGTACTAHGTCTTDASHPCEGGAGCKRHLTTRLRLCTARNDCIEGDNDNIYTGESATGTIWTRQLWPTAPTAAATEPWDVSNLIKLAFQVQMGSEASPGVVRFNAVMFQMRVKKPDEPIPITLADHNKGTDDGKFSVFTIGDSTNGGTLSGVCPAGTPNVGQGCTYQDYCSGTSWPAEHDKPVGGCRGTDTVCRTCTARRTDFSDGSGYLCGDGTHNCGTGGAGSCSAAGCENGLALCCTNNTAVSCNVDADCTLGTCDSTATCVDSCGTPGVDDCPERLTWGSYIAGRLGLDVLTVCAYGGETTPGLVANRAANILAGSDGSCSASVGSGACTCSTTAQCNACTKHPWVGCTTDADCQVYFPDDTCETGGTCGTDSYGRSVCTAGPIVRTGCTKSGATGNCASGTCAFYPPDYLVILEGYNDVSSSTQPSFGLFNAPAPDCKGVNGAYAASQGEACDSTACPDTLCKLDSDCSAIAADSQCIGLATAVTGVGSPGTSYGCGSSVLGITCTSITFPCAVDADCPTKVNDETTAFTCKNADGSAHNDATDWARTGICACGTCPSTHTCVSAGNYSLCRLECASDAACGGTAGSCNGTPLTCKGRCTCPSDARECATAEDCRGPVTDDNGITRAWGWGAACVTGQCSCVGPNPCRIDATCPNSYQSFYGGATHVAYVDGLHDIQTMIDDLGEVDGEPVIVANTIPATNNAECFGAFPDTQYTERSRVHLLNEFALVPDSYRRLRRYNSATIHRDTVHFSATGVDLIGGFNATFLSTLGTCAYQDANSEWTPQKYCRLTATNVWTAGSCATSNDCTVAPCTAGSCTCQVRRCGCSCRSNAECNNWYGLGANDTTHTCTAGVCKKAGVDDCDAYDDGVVNSSSACTAGVCTNFCPCAAESGNCHIDACRSE